MPAKYTHERVDTGGQLPRAAVSRRSADAANGTPHAVEAVMTNILPMLLGAAFVTIGVFASALADRIRQLRLVHRSDTRTPMRELREPTRAPKQHAESNPLPGSSDIVTALVGAGYKKVIASQAVAACTSREQATPESWTAAALRRCAQGSAS